MASPGGMTLVRAPQVGNPGMVSVTIRPQTHGFTEAMARLQRALRGMGHALGKFGRRYTQRREVWVAGLSARYYVRGGLDSRYRSREDVCELVRDILRGQELGELGLDFREREQIAEAVIVGWVQGQGREEAVVPLCSPDQDHQALRQAVAATIPDQRAMAHWTPAP